MRHSPQVAGGTGNGRYSALRPASARRGMHVIAGIYACFRHEKPLCHHDRLRTGSFGCQFHEARSGRLHSQNTVAGKTAAPDKGAGAQSGGKAQNFHIRAQEYRIQGDKPAYLAGSPDRHGRADTGRERYGQGTHSGEGTRAKPACGRTVRSRGLRHADWRTCRLGTVRTPERLVYGSRGR